MSRYRAGISRVQAALVVFATLRTAPALAQMPGVADPGARAPATRASNSPQAGDLPPPEAPRPLAETLSGEPKRDYDAALLLHKSGDFTGAARRFLRAYEASSDVRLLWNAAVCEQALRHYAKAIALVERYLASRSPLIGAEAERNAQAFLDAALPLTARLIVESNQSGARVYLDDEPLGALPLDASTRIDFGTHRLVVRKPEFVDRVETVTVTSAADVQLRVDLVPIVHQGRLVVRARHGDSISIDGRFVGLSTFEGVLPSGKHVLRVTAAGARPYESQLIVEDDRTRAIDVTLEPEPTARGIPGWAWVAGGALLAAGAGTAAYFLLRTPEDNTAGLPSGSAGTVQLPWR